MSVLHILRAGGRGRGRATTITLPEIHEGVSQRQLELLAQRAYVLGKRDGAQEVARAFVDTMEAQRESYKRDVRRMRAETERP